jgi:hypothetical protein
MTTPQPRNRQQRQNQNARNFFIEQAAAYYDELNTITKNAPLEQTFDLAEAFAIKEGKELIRQSLQTITQERIDEFEKKKRNETLLEMSKEKKTSRISMEKTNEHIQHRVT